MDGEEYRDSLIMWWRSVLHDRECPADDYSDDEMWRFVTKELNIMAIRCSEMGFRRAAKLTPKESTDLTDGRSVIPWYYCDCNNMPLMPFVLTKLPPPWDYGTIFMSTCGKCGTQVVAVLPLPKSALISVDFSRMPTKVGTL
jgi:hypothetical protein